MRSECASPEYTRSALFLDFDNIFSCFERQHGKETAKAFATNPERWLAWIAEKAPGADETTRPCRRKFLIRRCYLNPEAFYAYRRNFTHAAFEVVDCPPLTEQGKTSTDIHLVMDALDALCHPVHLDEFIILSGDADFTPLLLRLRRHDKITAILSPGHASHAYKASCDGIIPTEEFIRDGMGVPSAPARENGGPPARRAAQKPRKDAFRLAHPEIADLAWKVHAVCGLPYLAPGHYARLFDELAREINENGYHKEDTAKAVAERCTRAQASVSQEQVGLLMQRAIEAGRYFRAGREAAEELAEFVIRHAIESCSGKLGGLTGADLGLLRQWLGGGLEQSN